MNQANATHSALVGYIIWIFGFLGAHRFYMGPQQHLYNGMATTVWSAAGVPGDRPGRVFRLGDGSKEGQSSTGGID